MKLYSLYEGKNVFRSHIYDRFYRISDPFIELDVSKRKSLKTRGFLEHNPTKLIHNLSKTGSDNEFVEFKIIDEELLNDIISCDSECLIDRYIADWRSGKYFLKRYKSIIYKIDKSIVVFKGDMYDLLNESEVIKFIRDNKINIINETLK